MLLRIRNRHDRRLCAEEARDADAVPDIYASGDARLTPQPAARTVPAELSAVVRARRLRDELLPGAIRVDGRVRISQPGEPMQGGSSSGQPCRESSLSGR
ncbi:hypothetical protein ACVGVM_10205 [Pseudonocardia bannensis]|uniref:hypothetical protein n=1 Tax=Pseudonocardia bannensis TaxID=630973 RepID=UPI001FE623CA|nr:hypothetical protein [Pseudonocardia bannensis]